MDPKILIGIPCFNCEKQVSRVITKIVQMAASLEYSEITFVDNRSTDNTIQRITSDCSESALKEKVAVLKNDQNYGLGGTHKVIFNYAIKENYDWVIILHGDDQACIEDIPKISNFALDKSCTVLGSRFMKESQLINYQRTRILGNKALNILFSIVTRKSVKDLGSGLNIFKVSELKQLPLEELPDSFNFNSELLLRYFSNGIVPLFYPITWSESDQLSNARNIKVAVSMLKSLFRWFFRSEKSTALYTILEKYTYRKL